MQASNVQCRHAKTRCKDKRTAMPSPVPGFGGKRTSASFGRPYAVSLLSLLHLHVSSPWWSETSMLSFHGNDVQWRYITVRMS